MNSIEIQPIKPFDKTVAIPGSKSITNRALIIASLANGITTIERPLVSEDTEVLSQALSMIGIGINRFDEYWNVLGGVDLLKPTKSILNIQNSGTSIRFLTSLLTLGKGSYTLDGIERMRQRPISDLVNALTSIGVQIDYLHQPGFPPIHIHAHGFSGGKMMVNGDISSQFLSSLLLTSPYAQNRTEIHIQNELVSRPYIDMTLAMMQSFGVSVNQHPSYFEIEPQNYRPQPYLVEPDASGASYFFAAAAITQSKVLIPNLHLYSIQGDTQFVKVLQRMGALVHETPEGILLEGKELHGIDIDLNEMPDMAQTLACTAVFADSPTTIRHVGNLAFKETDRLQALVTELSKLQVKTELIPEGIKIFPGIQQGGRVSTYNDHRMAMSFSLLGLKQPGIHILDPLCVQKTFPNFFDLFLQL